mmetsp:Transcript_14736/g.39037  ORF Transcript_14736/g.39037 Transcript_14736/m.39037 type:complete len:228 (-) Transcript_14736:365-1048(-)
MPRTSPCSTICSIANEGRPAEEDGGSRDATRSSSPSRSSSIVSAHITSATIMKPGECEHASGSLAFSSATCGVTPQPQKTGTCVPSAIFDRTSSVGASPNSGEARSATPIAAGSPTCTGPPCCDGYLALTAHARSTSSPNAKGRMLTTMLPPNAPDGCSGMLVRYMGTLRPASTCATESPSSISADSNVNEHPMAKATNFPSSLALSRAHAARSGTSATATPSRKTR